MSRMKPDERRESILTAALILAEETSYLKLTLNDVGDAACVSFALVHHYFKSSDNLRKAVMSKATVSGNIRVIAQGLAHNDSIAQRASVDHRYKASLMIQKG